VLTRYDEFVTGVRDIMAAVRLGSPLDPDTDPGPLEEYTVVKHARTDLTAVARKPWHRIVFPC
jgi:acyl-CoA reductase-like NAD-dependent aldehyde dehydrogenase